MSNIPKLISNLALRKKLIHRSKQRGWLEVDIILGSWANDNIMKLKDNQLNKYEKILNQDTTDIFDYIIKSKDIPKSLDQNLIFDIRNYSKEIDFSKLKSKLPN